MQVSDALLHIIHIYICTHTHIVYICTHTHRSPTNGRCFLIGLRRPMLSMDERTERLRNLRRGTKRHIYRRGGGICQPVVIGRRRGAEGITSAGFSCMKLWAVKLMTWTSVSPIVTSLPEKRGEGGKEEKKVKTRGKEREADREGLGKMKRGKEREGGRKGGREGRKRGRKEGREEADH